MALSSRHIVSSALGVFTIGAVILACGSDGSTFKDGTDTPSFGDASFGVVDGSANDPYANDPAPQWCGPDGGAAPEVTGTEACPSDKNKPGCPCDTVGETKPCWTGLRADRNLGICKDGVATCRRASEYGNVWSECVGEQLPVANATGAQGCDCFSLGFWDIKNTSPCLHQQNGTYWAYSTTYDQATGTVGGCTNDNVPSPGQVPSGIWSTDKLTVDCAGTFTLCFRIRAGDYNNPSTNDCILGETCIENAQYSTSKTELDLPALPAWAGKDNACAKKWETTDANTSPGYGEMIVKGKTVTCETVGGSNDYVFHRVQYCPNICRTEPNSPACIACQNASSGEFKP